jgi:enamine deaminase RidA (YjgF/YER057c/UK114 family)
MSRKEISSGRPWERKFNYSRAVRLGDLFQTSLTSPADESGRIVCKGDVYGQTRQSMSIILRALVEAGLGAGDIVATRVYMLDTTRWEDAARAHAELVTDCRPALSFIGVANFFDPDILVECEVTAAISSETSRSRTRS